MELQPVIDSLMNWGAKWAFGEPSEEQLDPLLLMWWMRSRVRREQLSQARVVVQFDFLHRRKETYWLILTPEDVSICLTDPGYDNDVLVIAELRDFFQLWLGNIGYHDALRSGRVRVDALPALRDQAISVVELWQDNLRSLVDGDGPAVVTQAQVESVDDFLTDLAAATSPDLQQVITAERARLGALDDYVGLSVRQAKSQAIGDPTAYLPLVPSP